MNPPSSHPPSSKLGQRLLSSARDDRPPESSTQRALEQVRAARDVDQPRGKSKRGTLQWIAAAAVLLSVVLIAVIQTSDGNETPVSEPLAKPPLNATAAATATAAPTYAARTNPPKSASADGGVAPSATVAASALAKHAKPKASHKGAGAKPIPGKAAKPFPAKGSCACAPGDLMCQMRCGQK